MKLSGDSDEALRRTCAVRVLLAAKGAAWSETGAPRAAYRQRSRSSQKHMSVQYPHSIYAALMRVAVAK